MKKILIQVLVWSFILLVGQSVWAQGVVFNRDFSPAEGLVIPQENPFREEICLNGLWEVQIAAVPADWERGKGVPPELPFPVANQWEETKIKIPSPINVNNWGDGANVGEGTDKPYAPSSIYYPSYPQHWIDVQMGWLKREISIPADWKEKRVIIHFEAVAGDVAVYINGKKAGSNFDSWMPFEVDITDYIKKNEANELLLGLRHSRLFDKRHPDFRYFGATYPPGSNTDNLIGIWQDVYMFAVPAVRVTDVFIKPWLDRNELEVEVKVINQSPKKKKITLAGDVKEWINKVDRSNVLTAAEINWELGATALKINSDKAIDLASGEEKTITLKAKVNDHLKKWSPDSPNLYTLLLNVNEGKNVQDVKATRFGWRQFTIVGQDFHLNGEKIQCFGDIQHPFSAFICSRRFAYAWYQMIKDFGGNAVRPHAQPWPRVYYQLADEMGLMVLDETALFGSSIRLNLEEDITWERSQEHLDRLILRDRNHPSVVGWSAGNEMFAIALLNKPPQEISDVWDDRMVELTLSAKKLDPTRDFITLDGDRDMDGRLPVWSKHFGHGLMLHELPLDIGKPLIVGESGATYYGRPIQLYPFVGDRAFESYYGRNEALAIDVYQNAVFMARPHLAYFSPSEVCWFGIEHQNLGYHDYSRLPNINDGIFAGKEYVEGKPGYQYERIPPYVTTFNPGLDPQLPLYKSLPMFEALKAALSQAEPLPSPWDTFEEVIRPERPAFPAVKYEKAGFVGYRILHNALENVGITFTNKNEKSNLLFVDAKNFSQENIKAVEQVKKDGGIIFIMLSDKEISPLLQSILPAKLELTGRYATALENGEKETPLNKYFDLPALYFAEMEGDKKIQKLGLAGDFVKNGDVIFTASRTDWSLFNHHPENRKCAQVVLYEHLEKPEGAALVSCKLGNATFVISALDYKLETEETFKFWQSLFSAMGIKLNPDASFDKEKEKKAHDLLMDGPVN
jgi:beta-galactosidase